MSDGRSNTESPNADRIAVAKGLLEESDRGCVLVGAAMLDAGLGNLFRARFARSAMTTPDIDALLSKVPRPALESLWLKVELAFGLGWISAEVRAALHAMGELHAAFATETSCRILTDSRVQPIVVALAAATDELNRQREFINACREETRSPRVLSQARTTFMACVLCLLGRIERVVD